MPYFLIPVYVKRKGQVRIIASGLEEAFTEVENLGNDNKVTGISGQNLELEINWKEVQIYNPECDISDELLKEKRV